MTDKPDSGAVLPFGRLPKNKLARGAKLPLDYALADAEALHAEYPDTFWIPERWLRESLQPGDIVKLIFEVVDAPEGIPGAERMWVRVISSEAGAYVGELDNHPTIINTIAAGSPVAFGPQHVIDTAPSA